MAITLAAAARTAECDAVGDLLDSGKLLIYTGSQPDVDAAATGTLLATFTLNVAGFGAASDDGTNADATAGAIANVNASDGGTPAYFRATKSDDTVMFQGSVGTSGADLNLDSASITAGQELSITSFVYRKTQA